MGESNKEFVSEFDRRTTVYKAADHRAKTLGVIKDALQELLEFPTPGRVKLTLQVWPGRPEHEVEVDPDAVLRLIDSQHHNTIAKADEARVQVLAMAGKNPDSE